MVLQYRICADESMKMQWHLFRSQQQGILSGLLLSNLCLVVLEVARYPSIVCLLHIARCLRPGGWGMHSA